jgi:hypothetical protein
MLTPIPRFTSGKSPVNNRVHSGCNTSISKSLCKISPFSMRSWDQSDATKPLQCDEFPMNAFKQAAYVDGTHRNSLRCITGVENGSERPRHQILRVTAYHL